MQTAIGKDLADRLVHLVPRLVARCARRLRVPSAAHEDIVQDVLVALLEHDLALFNEEKGTLEGFVAKRVHWTVGSAGRSAAKDLERRSQRVLPSVRYETRQMDEDPEAALIAQHDARTRARCIPALRQELALATPEERHVVREVDLRGRRQIQVAFELGLNPSSVCRARQRVFERTRARLAA